MNPLCRRAEPPAWARHLYTLGTKLAADGEVAYNLAGVLYLASTGWLLLAVPNALVQGVFAAMHEAGAELPPGPDGRLNAHISVFTKEEVDLVGAERITERGKQFHYRLGGLYSVVPDGWPEIARVWYLRIHSPELQELRRSYGLSSLPRAGEADFHVTCAVVRKGVLGRNEKKKSA